MGNYDTYENLLKLLTMVAQNNISSTVDKFLYVLNPYVTSLGYDVINLDLVKSNAQDGVMQCIVNEEVNIVFTLNKEYKTRAENDRIWVYIDVDNSMIYLKFYVVGKWRKAFEVNLLEDSGEENFNLIQKYTKRSELVKNMEKYGAKFLYDGALTFELVEYQLNNDFIKDILMQEIANPSEAWLKVIAEGLTEKYSLKSTEDVNAMLSMVMENGLEDVLVVKHDKNVLTEEPNYGKMVETEQAPISFRVPQKETVLPEADEDGYADLSKLSKFRKK